MYNYQTFLRSQLLNKKFQEIQQEFQKHSLKRNTSTPLLAAAHQKRVQSFAISAIDRPIIVNLYKDNIPSFRSYEPSKIITAQGFYLKKKIDAQKKDSLHFQKSCQDHRRCFTPVQTKKSMMKVLNDVHQNAQNKIRITLKKKQKPKQQPGKIAHPELSQKTYFKSIQSCFSQISAVQVKEQTHHDQNQSPPPEKVQQKKLRNVSRRDNFKEALLKCNLMTRLHRL